ncbi:MAG: T9SS type A sorting domain-containing protein [Candidatus Limimorpha sp.]
MKKVLLLTIGLMCMQVSFAQRRNSQELPSENVIVEKTYDDALTSECPGADNLFGEYYWEDGEFGTRLEWDRAEYEGTLDRYEIFRSDNGVDYKLVKRIVNTPSISHYGCVDIISKPGKYYYQLIAYYQDGCESDPVELSLDVTSVNEEPSTKVSIYPNPASNVINVVAKSMDELTIFNALGQAVVTKNVDDDSTVVDISSLNKGMYVVRITAANGVFEKILNVID